MKEPRDGPNEPRDGVNQTDKHFRREKDSALLGTTKMVLHCPIFGVWMTPHAGPRSAYFNIGLAIRSAHLGRHL